MKNFLALLFLSAIVASTAVAQQRVHPKDLEGSTWQLVFDLEKEADNAFERIALKAVTGFMDEIDIQFDFRKDSALRVRVNAFNEENDEEYSNWAINDEGQLSLGDTDSFDAEDTVFMRDGDLLIPFEYKRGKLERKESIYLKRVDR
jgi:opacity protein-like surface antigen